jgi:ankyrin repeat protein
MSSLFAKLLEDGAWADSTSGCFAAATTVQGATAAELAAVQRLQLHTTPNSGGCTALHYAAAAHKPKLVQQLLKLGADPNVKIDRHLTPLHFACMGRVASAESFKRLLTDAAIFDALRVSCSCIWWHAKAVPRYDYAVARAGGDMEVEGLLRV